MLKLHVVFAVDRAGLVGEDGETHHGVFDVGFLRHAPGMTVLAPASCSELKAMLNWAVNMHSGPVAIRYPRGGDGAFTGDKWDKDATVVTHCDGTDAAIVTYGHLVNNAVAAAEALKEDGIEISVIRLTALAPIDFAGLAKALNGIENVIVAEETCAGVHEAIAWELGRDHRITVIDLQGEYVTHGKVDKLYEKYALDAASMANRVKEALGK